MSGLIENFIRRIEKIVTLRSTIPLVGTNHVDDVWIDTDIYPGELSVNMLSGSLYTSDGQAIIDLNRENLILSGLVLSKSTSGLNKLEVSSGHVRINGIHYYHESSGTDIEIGTNFGPSDKLYFIYAQPDTALAVGYSASDGNLKCSLSSTYVGWPTSSGALDESGIFNSIISSSIVPVLPVDSILLGTVLVPAGANFDLFPRSVANIGDYYPKFSSTPSQLLRSLCENVNRYDAMSLYFPTQFVLDNISNTIYVSKHIFVSDNVADDIISGHIIPVGGSGSGGTGASGSMTVTNMGTGAGVYQSIVGSQIRLRSILGSSSIQVTQNADDISLSLASSFAYISSIQNVGAGSQVLKSTVANISSLRSIKAGTNVQVTSSTDEILITVPVIGTTAQGVNLGTGATVYGGMSGKDLTFKGIGVTGGLILSSSTDTITLSGSGFVIGASNTGAGIGLIYNTTLNQRLQLRSLVAGPNITITTGSDSIMISATGSGASASYGINIGSIGGTAGQVYAGMSGAGLTFKSIVGGYGVEVYNIGNDVVINSTISSGPQGSIGMTGTTGPIGDHGIDGIDGINGPQGLTGPNGSQGFQGPTGSVGIQGTTGPQGVQGPRGFQGTQGFQGFQGASSTIVGPQGYRGFQGFQGFEQIGPQGIQGPIAPSLDMRFIEKYDSIGGVAINIGGNALHQFDTLRINTSSSLYTPIGSTSIQINEDGPYLFMYTVSYTVPNGTDGKFYLYDVVSGLPVNGSSIFLNPAGGTELVTATGKVGMTCSSGKIYAIKGECTGLGAIISYANASSFTISRLEAGQGPQGPQGFAVPGPTGPTGGGVISVVAPLTGDGDYVTPVNLMYSSDFVLNGSNALYLNLDYTFLVNPTIGRQWSVFKVDGITPFASMPFGYAGGTYTVGPTSSLAAIIVPTGCKVSYGGTATIPATGPGENSPTSITGDWTWGSTASYPVTSFKSTSNIVLPATYAVNLLKPKDGLMVDTYDYHVIRAYGNDTSSSSDSVDFLNIFYWGMTSILGVGNISQIDADTLVASDIESLSNYRLGTQAQTLSSVTDISGERLVIAYPATYTNLSSILMDGGLPILSSFIKTTSDITITTLSGSSVAYKVYVAVADDSYSNNQIITA